VDFVSAPRTPEELEALRASVNRQSPYGSETWSSGTQPGLLYTGLRTISGSAREERDNGHGWLSRALDRDHAASRFGSQTWWVSPISYFFN
jgi:hypothetical protein